MNEIIRRDNGDITINFDQLKKISIDHIADVLCYRIIRSGDLITHDIEFRDSGKCHLTYTTQGQIVACKMSNMTTEVNLDEGLLILKALVPGAQ